MRDRGGKCKQERIRQKEGNRPWLCGCTVPPLHSIPRCTAHRPVSRLPWPAVLCIHLPTYLSLCPHMKTTEKVHKSDVRYLLSQLSFSYFLPFFLSFVFVPFFFLSFTLSCESRQCWKDCTLPLHINLRVATPLPIAHLRRPCLVYYRRTLFIGVS